MTEKGNNTFHIIMFIAAVLAVLICGDAGWYFLVIVWLLVAVLWFPPAWLKSYPDTKILRNISFKLGITLLTLIIGYTIYNKYFNILCYYELETNTGLYYDKEKKEKEDVKYVDQPFVNTKITIYNAKELKIDDGEKIIPLTYEIQQKFDLEPGENVVAKEIKASNFFETETKIIYETVYYLTANEIAQIKINDKKAGIQAAKEEAENKAYEEERMYTKDSPLKIMRNTSGVDSNLTSIQINNNKEYYNGKIVKNWKLGVADVKEYEIKTFIPGLGSGDGGSHGWFIIQPKEVKDWVNMIFPV